MANNPLSILQAQRRQRQTSLSDALTRLKQRLQQSTECDRELYTIVLGVSRNVDVLVNARDRYEKPQEMYGGIMQVARYHSNDRRAWPVLVVLLLSAKGACSAGWFAPTETEELLTTLNTLLACWTRKPSTVEPVVSLPLPTTPNDPESVLSTVLWRFCPRLHFTEKIMDLEVEVGYQILACDFHVARRLKGAETVRLFVSRKSDISTSACLVTPPCASFMVNGKGIAGRTIVNADKSSQMPSDITGTVRLGPNLLQVVGEFSMPFIVIIGFFVNQKWDSSLAKLSPITSVKDVSEGKQAAVDDELEEGPSRVSLVCPISHLRIKTPVKGASCRHHQCFDYDSFVAINERRPAWRCPYCNTSLTLQDIQLDGNLAKVLQEVQDQSTVNDVLIFPNGNWQPVRNKRSAPLEGETNNSKKAKSDSADGAEIDKDHKKEAEKGSVGGPIEGQDAGTEPEIVDLSDVVSQPDNLPFVDFKPSAQNLIDACKQKDNESENNCSGNGIPTNQSSGVTQGQILALAAPMGIATPSVARSPSPALVETVTNSAVTNSGQNTGSAPAEAQAQSSPSSSANHARVMQTGNNSREQGNVEGGGAQRQQQGPPSMPMDVVEQRAHRQWLLNQQKLAAKFRELVNVTPQQSQQVLPHPPQQALGSGSQQSQHFVSPQSMFRPSSSLGQQSVMSRLPQGSNHNLMQQQYIPSTSPNSFPSQSLMQQYPSVPSRQQSPSTPENIASRAMAGRHHSLGSSGLRDKMQTPMTGIGGMGRRGQLGDSGASVSSSLGTALVTGPQVMGQGWPVSQGTPIMSYQKSIWAQQHPPSYSTVGTSNSQALPAVAGTTASLSSLQPSSSFSTGDGTSRLFSSLLQARDLPPQNK